MVSSRFIFILVWLKCAFCCCCVLRATCRDLSNLIMDLVFINSRCGLSRRLLVPLTGNCLPVGLTPTVCVMDDMETAWSARSRFDALEGGCGWWRENDCDDVVYRWYTGGVGLNKSNYIHRLGNGFLPSSFL